MADGYVLVHGGLHGAWCWDRVIPLLDKPALAIDLPGRSGDPGELASISYAEWIASAADDLRSFGPDQVCLVAHSLGGITITGLARAEPQRVASMVFISSVIPAAGETAAHAIGGDGYESMFVDGLFTGPPAEILREHLMNGVDDATAQAVIARVRPEPERPFLEPMRYDGLPPVPTTYVRLSRDKGLPPDQQARMISSLGITDVRTIDSCHNVMISEPELLAALLVTLGAS
ncbi:MAG: alpha/beta fold hydrolase [Mycetocola sp.]